MSYADTIKALREKLLLTQMELAAKLGVSYASVNRWENGKCEPTMKIKRKIRAMAQKTGIEGEAK
jgi:DNA-binding XRE family transcriptional regulator